MCRMYKGFSKMDKALVKFATKLGIDPDEVACGVDTITDEKHIWNCEYSGYKFKVIMHKPSYKVEVIGNVPSQLGL